MSNQALPLWAVDVSVAHWAPGDGLPLETAISAAPHRRGCQEQAACGGTAGGVVLPSSPGFNGLAWPQARIGGWRVSFRYARFPCCAPVGFQNSATSLDLGFYATRSYSLMRPPRTGRR